MCHFDTQIITLIPNSLIIVNDTRELYTRHTGQTVTDRYGGLIPGYRALIHPLSLYNTVWARIRIIPIIPFIILYSRVVIELLFVFEEAVFVAPRSEELGIAT